MEQQVVEQSHPEENQETLFDSNTDIEPENIPLPRSSMISVRLSDVQLQPATEEIDASSRTSVRQSTASSPRSSRSSSRTSASSISVNTVDWEGLGKAEEQEARDDATDEVRYYAIWNSAAADNDSPPLFCWPD